ncbi:MAG: hypothetical protein JO013_08035 [Alphaproteobacteria bacterium]|nr:hypothetical protein [Alphaproteobacteria bacterium]
MGIVALGTPTAGQQAGPASLASVVGCAAVAAEVTAVPDGLTTRIAIDPGMLERIGTRFRIRASGVGAIAYVLKTTSVTLLPAGAPRRSFEARTGLTVTCSDGTVHRVYFQRGWPGAAFHPIVVADGRIFEAEGDPAARLRDVALFEGRREE